MRDNESEEDKSAEVDIKPLKSCSFQDREDLKEMMKKWSASKNMKLYFDSKERENIATGIKVSTLFCSNKTKTECKFYVEFRTKGSDNPYYLHTYHNVHNHSLLKYHNSSAIVSEVLEEIKSLLPISNSCTKVAEAINNRFSKNFHPRVIYYQMQKLGELEFEKATDDAQILISLLERDEKEEWILFC